MRNYGKAIKSLRKSAGMTQAQLAEKLNVMPQTVSKWENGINTPDIDGVESMCSLFSISMDMFMNMADDAAPTSPRPTVAPAPAPVDVKPAPAPVTVSASESTAAANIHAAAANEQTETARAKKTRRLKPIYIALIAIAAAIVAFVAVFVPTFLSVRAPKVLSASEIYQKTNPSVFYIEVEKEDSISGGSGFFINSTGTAVTNYHVIDGIESAKITLSNGNMYDVDKILGVDEERDIAIIHVAVKSSAPVTFADSNDVKTGDRVYAIGFPQSFILGVQDSTLTEGIVSKSAYNVDGMNYIQSTVDITHGNSGGVLVDAYGYVVGMTTAGINIDNVNYMNLAIPANAVKNAKKNVNLSVEEYSVKSAIRYQVAYMIENELYAVRVVSAAVGKAPNIIPDIEGAKFLGWYADYSFDTPFDMSKRLEGNVSVYGKLKYTSTVFEFSGGAGGTGSMENVSVAEGKKFTFPDNMFERQGYRFTSWNLDGVSYSVGDVITVKDAVGAKAVVAEWLPIEYTVVYSYNGSKTNPKSCVYDRNFKLERALYERAGYKQTGWSYNGKTYGVLESVRNLTAVDGETVVLEPAWSRATFNVRITFNEPEVTFIGNKYGKNTGRVYADYKCTYGVDPFSGETPKRDFFVFDGWRVYDPDGKLFDGRIEYACGVDGGTVFVEPVWMSGAYTLELGDMGALGKVKLFGKESYTLPLVKDLNDHFIGTRILYWKNVYSDKTYADGATVSDLMPDGYSSIVNPLVRLRPVYEPIEYTVEFDGNGGDGSMQELSCTYGTEYALLKNTFVRTGYTFVGWELGETVYADEEFVKNLTAVDGEKVTLVAKWQKNEEEGD